MRVNNGMGSGRSSVNGRSSYHYAQHQLGNEFSEAHDGAAFNQRANANNAAANYSNFYGNCLIQTPPSTSFHPASNYHVSNSSNGNQNGNNNSDTSSASSTTSSPSSPPLHSNNNGIWQIM
jgi:hypothetical protein